VATDDGEELYIRGGPWGFDDAFLTSCAGRLEVRLGRVDEGRAKLERWDSAPVTNPPVQR
jgi:hypothetical protein